MASHHGLRCILKTPLGYLTPTGTTEDICDKNIIVLNIHGIGGYSASEETQKRSFLRLSSVNFSIEECNVLQYSCPYAKSYDCCNCSRKNSCDFLQDRKKCKLS